ncbi:MAG: hypothetical protein NTZ18_03670 [Candidatus Komeilibacteria bacterium]|nr:hypothetical protein [Candidatus Komeilibacteria bacterium]
MAEQAVEIVGLKEFQTALARNPQKVLDEVKRFFVRGMAHYRRVVIQTAPWKVGESGGGAPVDTKNLVQSHVTKYNELSATFGPDQQIAPYAKYVHEGTVKMTKRPWLDWAKDRAQEDVLQEAKKLLDTLVKDLAN